MAVLTVSLGARLVVSIRRGMTVVCMVDALEDVLRLGRTADKTKEAGRSRVEYEKQP